MSYYPKKIKSLKDIKSGYVCMTRTGKLFMCLRNKQDEFNKILANHEEIIDSDCYDGLNYRYYDSKDIIEVYGLVNDRYNPYRISTEGRPLLYKEPTKLTVDEISELLGYEVEIVGE